MKGFSDIKAERLLISKFLTGINDGYFSRCMAVLSDDCFNTPLHKMWYKCSVELHKSGKSLASPDVMIEAKQLGYTDAEAKEILDIEYDYSLSDYNPYELALYLSDLSRKMKLYTEGTKTLAKLEDDSVDLVDVTASLKKILANVRYDAEGVASVKTLGKQLLLHCQDAMNGKVTQGIPCGFSYIDNRGGLQLSDLDIVAGETSAGKTSLTLAMALGAASQGFPVAMYSLEMSPQQMVARLASIASGLSSSAILARPLSNDEYTKLYNGIMRICNYPIYIDESCTSKYTTIERSIRSMAGTYAVKLAVVDYVQLISSSDKEKRDRVSNAANNLKALARELNICIILVSQLRRSDGGDSPVPRMSQLKESGDIENAADNVYLIYRPESRQDFAAKKWKFPVMSEDWSRYDTRGTALLIQAKGRNQGTGECLLGWNGATTSYYDKERYDLAGYSNAGDEPPF